jgi:hypothetical protein
MVADIIGHNDDYLSLPAVLSAAATRASDTQVAMYAAAGVVITASAAVFRPVAWFTFASIGACIAAFGLWAIADRELRDRRAAQPQKKAVNFAWIAVRAVMSALGTVGALSVLFQMLAVMLGTWIS